MYDSSPDDIDLSSTSLENCTQVQLEKLYSKYQTHAAIGEYFKSIDAPAQLTKAKIPESFGMDLLVQMVLHKRADIPTLVGLLKKHFEDTHSHPAQACADALKLALVEDVADWDELSQKVVIRYDIPAELQLKIDQFQYPLPMVVEPRWAITNSSTGYYTIVKSLILRNNHHKDDICLDHINRSNQVALSINSNVVAFIRNKWRNLDKAKPGEGMIKFKARQKAFEKYDRVSRDVVQALMAQGRKLWLTHRYDKRGRCYSQGYHVNYQGNDWCKAVIQFAHEEVLNDT